MPRFEIIFFPFAIGLSLTHDQQDQLVSKSVWRDDCWNPLQYMARSISADAIGKHEGSDVVRVRANLRFARGADRKFMGIQHAVYNPGAGIGKVQPFKKVLKDGFTMIKCVKDEMYYSGDKYHHQKQSYNSVANVSIVHYNRNVPKEDRQAMSPEECFKFCRTVPDMLTFGILAGRECYCAPYFKQMEGDDSTCDSTCEGDQKQMCGGASKSSIYEMHMCANTEGELKQGIATLKAIANELRDETQFLMDVAKQAEKETADLQKILGIIGDPTASDNIQRAKVQAGVLLHLGEDAEKVVKKMNEVERQANEMLGSSLLQDAPDFSDFDLAVKADELIADMKKVTDTGRHTFDRLHSALELQHKLLSVGGSKEAQNRSNTYYDTFYFVRPEPMGVLWAKDKSTCGGDLAVDPIFALSEDGCAYACDQHRGCKGYNWFSKGKGVCLLFKDVRKVTHYDMCSKPLEGECAPPAGKDDKKEEGSNGLLQESVAHVATPFPFKTKSVQPNATLFKESVAGMCTEVHGCDGVSKKDTVWDCSLMENYQCKGGKIRGAHIEEETGGLAMSFRGSVPSGTRDTSCKVNPEPCLKCKKYSTCAGPYLETDEVEIKKGDVASYTWSSSGAVDSYEVFVGLYSKTCGLVDYQFQRGAKQDLQTFELFAPKTDKYYMKFMLGSYDGTGGGAVGADMKVKDVKQTKASKPRILDVGAKCKLKFSEYQGLSLKPDSSGHCKHCLKDSTKRCLKPDGSFPIPDIVGGKEDA